LNDAFSWYESLTKPSWAPVSTLFGQVWSVLYIVIFITFGLVFYNAITGKLPLLVALPFALNLVFNIAFTPIQFGLKNNFLASIDILLVVSSLIWAFAAIWPHMQWIAFVNTPYLLWGLFATLLQFSITYLNWK
jgi:benzodiazapine receptor